MVSQLGADVQARILDGDLGGAVAENMVASAFSKAGRDLYYFHDTTGSPELDFLFEKEGNTVIIECKASNNRATSMKFVLANPKRFGAHPAVKIADTNVGSTNDFDTLPLYSLSKSFFPANYLLFKFYIFFKHIIHYFYMLPFYN